MRLTNTVSFMRKKTISKSHYEKCKISLKIEFCPSV